MTRNALILIAAVGLAAAILILWRGSAATEAAVQDQAVIALGQRLYAENCATCHGADLEGQPDWQTPLANGRYPAPPHDETGHTWHHADALLERIIRDGTAAVVGNRPIGVPTYQANLGLDWDLPWTPGLSLNGSVALTGRQQVDTANTVSLPAWTRLDNGAR